MRKLAALVFCLSLFILISCKKDEEKSCKLSFTYSGGQIRASGCSSVTYSNITYNMIGTPISFHYSGCGETGTGFVNSSTGKVSSSCD